MDGRGHSHRHDQPLPDDLVEVAERLRSDRPEVSALDLDRIKVRAMASASRPHRKGTRMKSRSLAAVLTVALMAAGTGGVIAGNGNGNASNSQYRPGCGPPPSGVDGGGHTHTGQNGDRSQCYGNSGK